MPVISRDHLRLTLSSTAPLPQRDPGKTFRQPPATVGRPKPVPQPEPQAA
ncbi:hypothetical protein [Kitasatospora griseola]